MRGVIIQPGSVPTETCPDFARGQPPVASRLWQLLLPQCGIVNSTMRLLLHSTPRGLCSAFSRIMIQTVKEMKQWSIWLR